MEHIILNINGADIPVGVEKNWTLLYVLREVLGLTGAKCGCSTGDCGACRVIIDGIAVNSCLVRVLNAQGSRIETIEGLGDGRTLHTLQQAFVDCGAVQCGFCTPGMIMSAKALLDKTLTPSEQEIREAIAPNLCRCTGYVKIVEAVTEAARRMREAGHE
jgi:carbon-monoxide dehydrogenase small subunit